MFVAFRKIWISQKSKYLIYSSYIKSFSWYWTKVKWKFSMENEWLMIFVQPKSLKNVLSLWAAAKYHTDWDCTKCGSKVTAPRTKYFKIETSWFIINKKSFLVCECHFDNDRNERRGYTWHLMSFFRVTLEQNEMIFYQLVYIRWLLVNLLCLHGC